MEIIRLQILEEYEMLILETNGENSKESLL
jgi:hypothetical protein|nr:MAG TPA: hypothetical protein [Caudoviricetes sp.]